MITNYEEVHRAARRLVMECQRWGYDRVVVGGRILSHLDSLASVSYRKPDALDDTPATIGEDGAVVLHGTLGPVRIYVDWSSPWEGPDAHFPDYEIVARRYKSLRLLGMDRGCPPSTFRLLED